MKKDVQQKLWQGIGCLVCATLVLMHTDYLGSSEFSGGRVTGRLWFMFDSGSLLFVAALVMTFVYPRVAAAIALTTSFSCLPLYLYFVAPGPFRSVFRGQYTVPLQANFLWNSWALVGILALAATASVSVRSFLVIDRTEARISAGK